MKRIIFSAVALLTLTTTGYAQETVQVNDSVAVVAAQKKIEKAEKEAKKAEKEAKKAEKAEKRSHHADKRKRPDEGNLPPAFDELDLSDDQLSAVQATLEQGRELRQQSHAKIKQLREQERAIIQAETFDEAAWARWLRLQMPLGGILS